MVKRTQNTARCFDRPLEARFRRLASRWVLWIGLLALTAQAVAPGKAQTAASPAPETEKITKVTIANSSNATVSEKTPALPASTVSLDNLIREALDRNPSVKAAAHAVLASRARVPQVRTLPDPVLTTGWAAT